MVMAIRFVLYALLGVNLSYLDIIFPDPRIFTIILLVVGIDIIARFDKW